MARSSTSFGGPRSNQPAAVPGNKLALRHGATDPDLIELRMPAIMARVQGELDQVGYITQPDGSLVRSYCYISAQIDMREEWFTSHGGMFNSRGGPKAGVGTYLQLVHRQQELAKVLGLGAAPRAQIAQQMAGAGKDAMVLRAAQERLRAKQQQLAN